MSGFLSGKVVAITGSGGGIGRAVALAAAAEGARIVVADIGVSLDGGDPQSQVAEAVVAEIKAAGGEAVAVAESVTTLAGGEKIIGAGTRAAAIGGTTSIVDFAIQAKGTKMRDALDTWWKKAENRACIDYGLHMIVTDLPDAGLEDMDSLVGEGVASFKLFMAYPGVRMVDDGTIFKAMAQTAKNGALICMHAENGDR